MPEEHDGLGEVSERVNMNTLEIEKLRSRLHGFASQLWGIETKLALQGQALTNLTAALAERQRTMRWIIGLGLGVGPTIAVALAQVIR